MASMAPRFALLIRMCETTMERYLENTFGNVDSFCILMNIPVHYNNALPPNLWRDNTCLYEWSAETGPRWGDREDDDYPTIV